MRPDRTPVGRKPRLPPKPKTVERAVSQDQDPVEVFCRVRPFDPPDSEECIVIQDSSTLKLIPPPCSFAYRNGNAKEQHYKFQHVFGPEGSQKEVFDRVAKPLVADLLNCKNGLLFAYGVTGSGKTYTMEGVPKNGGIVRRTLDVLFNSIQEFQTKRCIFKPDGMNGFEVQTEADAFTDRKRQDATPGRFTKTPRLRREAGGSQDSSQRIPDTSRVVDINEDNVYSIFVAYIQIYNNYIYDLLEELPETGPTRGLQTKILREDAQHNMYVHGCTEVEVKTPEDALEVLYLGQKRRKIAYTKLNCESSRSHSIFTIRIVQAPLDAQGEEVMTDKSVMEVSQLSLVDLAGSERNIRTRAVGDRIKEAGNINNSLMNLRVCIEVLRENQMTGGNRKVPYRDSKLTHFFKNYFDGQGKVNMVVCVNPKADDYDETVTVMKFAELTAEVQVQRAQPARNDLGLPPGRRRANQLFKQVRRRLEEEGSNVKNLEVDLTPIYSLAPDWPTVCYTPDTMEEVVAKLKACLLKRIQNKQKLKTQTEDMVLRLRGSIMDMEKANLMMKKEILSLRAQNKDALGKVRSLESMLHNAELVNESLQRKFLDYNNLVDECNAVREERDMAKAQGKIEKQRIKARAKTQLELEKERIKTEMSAQLCNQKVRLYKTMKDLLMEDQEQSMSSVRQATSDTNLSQAAPHSPIKPTTSDSQFPNLQGPAVVNRRHRRSRSQGAEMWLDHHPSQEVPTGTILQPALQRRKSVTRLRSGDIVDSRVTNYCLTTQHQDSQGELETKLYKGDVLPTAGGGSQVVFQDVEILKQRTPLSVAAGPRKRSSDGTPKVHPSTVQDRCATGIQGYSTPRPSSFIKRSRV